MQPYEIKGILKGQPCICIGGGPTAAGVKHDNVIVTNLSLRLVPHALAHYFADCSTYEDYKDEIDRFNTVYRMTCCTRFLKRSEYIVFHRNARTLSDVSRVAGTNSGLHAACIGLHMEADPVILVGYDMNDRTHFHNEYLMTENSIEKYLKEFQILRGKNVFVTNPNSALTNFLPYKPLSYFGVK